MAYSLKIHDPAFNNYLKNTKNYRYQFAFALALVAVISFYFYGEFSSEMNNPEALYIGLVIGGIFILIGLFAFFSLKEDQNWEGEVVEKKIITNKNDTEFIVFFKDWRGRRHKLVSENDTTLYDYYKLGERVKYHGKLKTYEKYDKSKDEIIFCNACCFLNEISEHYCINCGCPLLK
jgi:hypothetical protein